MRRGIGKTAAGAAMLLVFVAGFAGCVGKTPLYYDIPRRIKVKVEGGIFVRMKPDTSSTQSAAVGAAATGETFKVIDARPAYYRISLPDGQQGWISANPEENWTTRIDENQVKVNLDGGIAVRRKPYDSKSPQIGVAHAQGYVYDIIDTEYSHFKILLPNGHKGWIFAGRPGSRLIEESYTP